MNNLSSLLSGAFLLVFLSSFSPLHGQFIGAFSLTPPAGDSYNTANTTIPLGEWSAYGLVSGISATSVDTTLAPNELTIFGSAFGGEFIDQQFFANKADSYIEAPAFPSDGFYSFDYTTLVVDGQNASASFAWLINGTIVGSTNGTTSNFYGPAPVSAGDILSFAIFAIGGIDDAQNGILASGEATITNFTYSAVPEPSHFALLAALGIVLGLLRSRR